jgi:hypothetical protein
MNFSAFLKHFSQFYFIFKRKYKVGEASYTLDFIER